MPQAVQADQSVFRINDLPNELLDQVLMCLPFLDLILIQRVSKKFKLATQSPLCQQELFFSAGVDDPSRKKDSSEKDSSEKDSSGKDSSGKDSSGKDSSGKDSSGTDDSSEKRKKLLIRLNPLLRPSPGAQIHDLDVPVIEGVEWTNPEGLQNPMSKVSLESAMSEVSLEDATSKVSLKKASWNQMFVVLPPVVKLCVYTNRKRGECSDYSDDEGVKMGVMANVMNKEWKEFSHSEDQAWLVPKVEEA